MAVERVLSNLNLISFKTEGGLQNHINELQDGDLVFTPDSSLKGNLFDFKWTDHKLNDISWLNADTFSWQSGDVYEAAYNHLAEDCKVYAWQYAPTQGGDIGYTTTETPAVGGVLMIGGNACNITEVGSNYVVAEHYKTGEARTYQRVADSDSTAFVAGVLSTETVSGVTISFYRAEDGHKIVGADQEANVQALYEATGVAWYYVLDTTNRQFKLPRERSKKLIRAYNDGYTWYRLYADGWVEQGGKWTGNLTISQGQEVTPTVTLPVPVRFSNVDATTKALYCLPMGYDFTANDKLKIRFGAYTVDRTLTEFDWSVSGMAATTPEQNDRLYFYVGNFERDALEQTAGITSEQLNNKADIEQLNNKVDIDLFNAIYPVGSIYIGTQSVCPMSIAIPNSTWVLLEAGRALWTGNGSNGNTKIAAGLPNITGVANVQNNIGSSGAFYAGSAATSTAASSQGSKNTLNFDASRSSSIYGNSTTVQPPAYVVNVWRRTA